MGVGLGGTFEKAAYLAKHALLREVVHQSRTRAWPSWRTRSRSAATRWASARPDWAAPSAVIDVFVEELPAHIASMPVAVNIQCHSARHKEAVL